MQNTTIVIVGNWPLAGRFARHETGVLCSLRVEHVDG